MSSSGGSGSLSHRFEPTRQGAYHVGILLTEGVSAWTAHDVNDGRPAALGWHMGHGALEDPRMPTHPASVSFVTLPEWSTLVPDAALVPGSEVRHLELVHG
ncbi:MAG: hypothetical protein KDB84_07720, partial [Flavobacteriales bacterium]|nr:hypothetical protein [Flavobacteriales bacterium]